MFLLQGRQERYKASLLPSFCHPSFLSECITLLRTLQLGDKDKWAEGELKLRRRAAAQRRTNGRTKDEMAERAELKASESMWSGAGKEVPVEDGREM